ncbi:MAG: 2-oxoacid:acceptor oxidoreductase subunit alpha [Synergistaceae bacterium]|jgi:2-oxoglutarate ferredoxin oxidoreductase subunit alpha|nr:2-oxoacid:acceptor oxidoreductase subunit alpha [Synergistaceae bacterium]
MNKKDVNDKKSKKSGKTDFLLGNVACAEGALYAGCGFFAAYPITPASDIGEHFVKRVMDREGFFIQTEDEIAAIGAVIGASWGGLKAMTATSGPGISLMLENIGLATATETPCVIVNVQRGGPSTGSPSLPLQADMLQARYGSQGDYELIACAPSSPQEMFDLTVWAFNAAEKYRTPVFVLSDALVGHMYEQVHFPEPGELPVINRKIPERYDKKVPMFLDEDVAPMSVFGRGLKSNVTGSTHFADGTRSVASIAAMDDEIRKLRGKLHRAIDEITLDETCRIEDADVVLYSYGSMFRAALAGMELARSEGLRVGCYRATTVWPFPEKRVRDLTAHCKAVIVCENNLGQMYYPVAAAVAENIRVLKGTPEILGGLPRPEDVVRWVKEALK